MSSYIADGRVVCKFKKHASSFGEYIPDFEKFIKKYIEDNKLSNMVFVNQVCMQYYSTTHVTRNCENILTVAPIWTKEKFYFDRE